MAEGAPPEPPAGAQRGRVLEAVGGIYRVQLDRGIEVEASLRGRLKQVSRTGDRVIPGDLVTVRDGGPTGGWTIEEVETRSSQLVRSTPAGGKPKVVAANVDRSFVVLSAIEPAFDSNVADRFLVLSEACGIPPTIVLNKMDLASVGIAEGAEAVYGEIGYVVLPTSARTGEGLDRLQPLLESGVSTLVGPSGVGKSSIMNALYPELELRTGVVTGRGGRGRHTTVGVRLLPLTAGSWVADTPGFSDVTLWEVDSSELSNAFPEFREPSECCRFRGCTHTHEPECAVLEAVEDGRIRSERYESYRGLLLKS